MDSYRSVPAYHARLGLDPSVALERHQDDLSHPLASGRKEDRSFKDGSAEEPVFSPGHPDRSGLVQCGRPASDPLSFLRSPLGANDATHLSLINVR